MCGGLPGGLTVNIDHSTVPGVGTVKEGSHGLLTYDTSNPSSCHRGVLDIDPEVTRGYKRLSYTVQWEPYLESPCSTYSRSTERML